MTEPFPPYEIFSTTADVGVRVWGVGFAELYRNALNGLNSLIFGEESPGTEQDTASSPEFYPFRYQGDGTENVLVNFLMEVLFLLQCHGQRTTDLDILTADYNLLDARFRLRNNTLLPELDIKSVTYHNLHVKDMDGKKTAEIIFDI